MSEQGAGGEGDLPLCNVETLKSNIKLNMNISLTAN